MPDAITCLLLAHFFILYRMIKHVVMNKIIVSAGIISMLLSACSNRNEETSTPPPENPPISQPSSPTKREKAQDSTTLRISNEGVTYSNKEGNKESNVQFVQDSANIEIKKKK